MNKIFIIPALACALLAPTSAAAQDDAEEPALKRDYTFRSAHPLTQIESLYTAIMAATPKRVQNTLGLELIASKDSIRSMAINPTGINVALVKKDKKGRFYLETVTTDGEANKLMAFDSKGGATLEDISSFVRKNVEDTSMKINNRSQTPTHKATGKLSATWKSKKA